jgi:hypothetical protein
MLGHIAAYSSRQGWETQRPREDEQEADGMPSHPELQALAAAEVNAVPYHRDDEVVILEPSSLIPPERQTPRPADDEILFID